MNRFDNIDCMIGMKEYPDKYFDLAIVDPPYGIGADLRNQEHTRFIDSDKWKNAIPKINFLIKKWDGKPPDKEYFNELRRVSKNQIIWGANHFISKMPYDSPGWIVWDKDNGESDNSDCELAYSSFDRGVRLIKLLWNGFQRCEQIDRIHPSQKPLKLYKWLLTKYAKPNDKILDTHVGSASSLIACEDMGFEYVGFELDKDYYEAAQKRLKQFRSQLKLGI